VTGRARRGVAATCALVLALVVPSGCGGDDDDREGVTTAPATRRHHGHDTTEHAGEPVEVHGTPPDQPPARLVRMQGDVVRARGPVEEGAALEAGDALVVQGPGRADVDLGDGGRVVLDADTEVRIGDGGPAQIVLVRGRLHAAVPAGPAGPRPPLRVATASVSVDLGGSGEVFVVADASGATWVAGLSGLTSVATGEADTRRRLRTVELPPGRALLVATRMAEPTEGPTRLEDARAASAAIFASAAELDAARAQRELAEAARRLDEALLWLETETRNGLDLTAQHRESVRGGSSEEGMRLQRALVTHAQQLNGLRQVATARWERLEAGTLQLARTRGAPASDLADSRRDRVASLLGL
jgi:hypothetical protein